MKRQIFKQIQTSVVLLLFVAACSENATDTWQDAGNGSPLAIQVYSNDFASTDGSSTRAADVEFATVFQDGDRMGIVAVQQDGSKQNLCATYNAINRAWEGIYYDSKVTTYLSAYFPYQEELANQLSGISDANSVLSALKKLVSPLPDQSSLTAYRASDLLTGTCTLNTKDSKSLTVSLTHAYSLLLFRAGTEYTTADGSYTYRTALSDVQVSVDDALGCVPLASAEGHRLIVEKTGSFSVEWFYTLSDGKTYKVGGDVSLAEGTYHLYKNVTPADRPRDFKVGDFYYWDGSIVPGENATPPTDGCIGIVCWVGSETFNEDPLLQYDYPGCRHGLVVSLHDADRTVWSDKSSRNEGIQNWINKENGNPYKSKVDLQETDKCCGYSNTLALMDYNAKRYESGNNGNYYCVLPCYAIQTYAAVHPAPTNSSGWFWPSFMELKYVCWGDGDTQSINGKMMLNTQLEKVGGTCFGDFQYWSSVEDKYRGDHAWDVSFDSGKGESIFKSSYTLLVRPLLAF